MECPQCGLKFKRESFAPAQQQLAVHQMVVHGKFQSRADKQAHNNQANNQQKEPKDASEQTDLHQTATCPPTRTHAQQAGVV